MTTTKHRYVPTGMVEFKPDIPGYTPGLCAVYVDMAKNTAIFYKGKSSVHLWYNRFRNTDDMKKKILSSISSLMAWEDDKKKRKESRKAATTLKLGDILYSSWGYDQTNIDFYQIVGLAGKQTVKLQKIVSAIVSKDGGPGTYVSAVKGQFVSEKMTTHRATNDHVRINSYASAYLWDGKPKYETASGWGH